MIFLIIISSCNIVKADEVTNDYPDITDDVEIRYKWYKEVINSEGEYVPLKEITEEDKIEKNNIKYFGNNVYSSGNCTLPSEYYLITEKNIYSYKRTYPALYILIENIDSLTDIQIYYKNKPIKFSIISSNDNHIKIDLQKEYLPDSLLFYVDTDKKYRISIYNDSNYEKLIVSKEIENTKFSIPDKTWISETTYFYTSSSSTELAEGELTKLMSSMKVCSYKEKYVYKYETIKEYYDENYYLNVDGYIKDEDSYRYFYKGEPITITNTVEIIKEKIVKEPKIEYVYIEDNKNDIEINDPSSEENCKQDIETKIKTKIVEKEIVKIPQKIYIVIIVLSIVIILLMIKIYKQYVE